MVDKCSSRKARAVNLYAFWNYDQYPYILGGTVTKILDSGAVETKEYGKGCYFRPFKIVPLKAGRVMRKKLRAMEHAHRTAKARFDLEWATHLKDLRKEIDL